jgi:hypothetical protein
MVGGSIYYVGRFIHIIIGETLLVPKGVGCVFVAACLTRLGVGKGVLYYYMLEDIHILGGKETLT